MKYKKLFVVSLILLALSFAYVVKGSDDNIEILQNCWYAINGEYIYRNVNVSFNCSKYIDMTNHTQITIDNYTFSFYNNFTSDGIEHAGWTDCHRNIYVYSKNSEWGFFDTCNHEICHNVIPDACTGNKTNDESICMNSSRYFNICYRFIQEIER